MKREDNLMISCKLIRYTPDPDRTVAMSAHLCYSPIGAAQIEEDMTDDQVRRLVRQLARMGHTSTFEHVTFTFAIEGVSRVLTHQLSVTALRPIPSRVSAT